MARLILLAFTALLFHNPCYAKDIPEHYVAMVGDVPITIYELNRHRDKILPFNVNFHGGVSAEKKQEITETALQEMIIRTYKVNYAKNVGLKAPRGKVKDVIKKIKGKYNTKSALKTALGKETLKEITTSYENTLLAKMAEEYAVESKVTVAETAVDDYYKQNQEMFFHPKQFRASHILIKVDPAATGEQKAERHEKAKGLMQQALDGEDFYNLAYYNSQAQTSFVGGDLGMFNQGQAVKEMENALLKMQVDDISIVETLEGYHVLKLTQVIEPRKLSFEETKSNIRALLKKEQRDAIYEEWMNNLKATNKVVRFDH